MKRYINNIALKIFIVGIILTFTQFLLIPLIPLNKDVILIVGLVTLIAMIVWVFVDDKDIDNKTLISS